MITLSVKRGFYDKDALYRRCAGSRDRYVAGGMQWKRKQYATTATTDDDLRPDSEFKQSCERSSDHRIPSG